MSYLTGKPAFVAAVERAQQRNIDDYPEWEDHDDEKDDRDPNLDPGFGSWNDYNRYKYGY